jgi:hypothetical protein
MKRILVLMLVAAGLAVASPAPSQAQQPVQSGTVEIDQVQAAFLISGNLGGGVLTFEGNRYGFTIGGLGMGGIGLSSIHATGEVYNLNRLIDFAGPYVQARTGFALGNDGMGTLVLQNNRGVYITLRSQRRGLALSLGGDAVYIQFD